MSKNNNDFFKKKKEWSKTKDSILGCYLIPYFQKIIAYKKPICYIDCFSGKGLFDDGESGSPIIALDCVKNAVEKSKFPSNISCYFIELNHAKALANNINKDKYSSVNYTVIDGKFEDNIDTILKNNLINSVFLYVDPYGIKAIDISKFNSFKLVKNKSVEMLINFNTWGFFREACTVRKIKYKMENNIEKYLVEYAPDEFLTIEQLNKIAGGNYWIDIVRQYKNRELSAQKAENELAKHIAKAFKNYKYVLNVPIKSSDDNKVPKYRLFHLTNHPDGCVLMANNMYKRSNEASLTRRNGQLSIFEKNNTVEGDYISNDKLKGLLLNLIDSYTAEKRLNCLLADFYTKHGIISDVANLRDQIQSLELNSMICVRREPKITKTGKETRFMTEQKGKKVFIKGKNHERNN